MIPHKNYGKIFFFWALYKNTVNQNNGTESINIEVSLLQDK